jgi:hypothetical protein
MLGIRVKNLKYNKGMQMKYSEYGFTVLSFIFLCVSCFLIVATVLSGYSSAKGLDRDTRRVNDVALISNALKSFYQDNGFYPQEGVGGIPTGIEDYISFWPVAPQPADGKCTTAMNEYKYTYLNSGNNFNLQFCLGNTTKNIKSGLRTINPIGIK